MNCIKLVDIETGEIKPLTDVDEEICKVLDKPFDENKWCYLGKERIEGVDWYNTICFALAMGHNYDKIKELWSDCDEILKIVDYLEQHYKPEAWYEV